MSNTVPELTLLPTKQAPPITSDFEKAKQIQEVQNISNNMGSLLGKIKEAPKDIGNGKLGSRIFNGMMPILTGSTLSLGSTMLNNFKTQGEQSVVDYKKFQTDWENQTQDNSYGTSIMKNGGINMEEMPKFVQTEKGELILDLNGNIYDVKAKKVHKQMEKNEITDVLLPGNVVLSNKIKIKKSDAEKIILGIDPMIYKEGSNNPEYKENKLSDIFEKDEHSLAELGKIVRNKYPIIDDERKYQGFAETTSNENKSARMLYIQKLVELNMKKGKATNPVKDEIQKMRLGDPKKDKAFLQSLTRENSDNPFDFFNMYAQNNLPSTLKNSSITNLQTLDPLNKSFPNPSFIPGKGSTSLMYNSFQKPVYTPHKIIPKNPVKPKPLNLTEAQRQQLLNDQFQNNLDGAINKLNYSLNELPEKFKNEEKLGKQALVRNMTGLALGSALGMASTLAQDNYVESPILKVPNLPREVDRSYYDYGAYQNQKGVNTMARAAFDNTSDFGKAMSYVLPAYAQAANANSNLAAQYAQQNTALESAYQGGRANTLNDQSKIFADSKNQIRKGGNDGIAQIGTFGINAINNAMALRNAHQDYRSVLRAQEEEAAYNIYNQLLLANQMKLEIPGNYSPKYKNPYATTNTTNATKNK